jgi:hypothetical protein
MAYSERAPYKQQAVENCSVICQIKNGPPSWAMAEASFDFQMAGRQIRWVVAITCENHSQFCLASQPPRISTWYLLGHLGAFNRQQVRELRSHCSSTIYKAHIPYISEDITALQISSAIKYHPHISARSAHTTPPV